MQCKDTAFQGKYTKMEIYTIFKHYSTTPLLALEDQRQMK